MKSGKVLRIFCKFSKTIIIFMALLFVIIGAFRVLMIVETRPFILNQNTATKSQAALVLGAGLLADGTPSAPLKDRVDMAIRLYQDGKIQKLLMSGDNRFVYYNEPEAMRQYAISQGIPDEDIVLDYAGRRTYDSCYRAGAIFGLTEIIVVTQNYHLPRAVFLCNHLNINTFGIPADQTRYLRSRYIFWRIREIIASIAAYWDVYISQPIPILGKFEPIF